MKIISTSLKPVVIKAMNIIGFALTLVCLYLVFTKIFSYQQQFHDSGFWEFSTVSKIFLFSVVHLAALNLLAVGWYKHLQSLSEDVQLAKVMVIYGSTQIAKYLPGNIFHFAGRQWLAKSNQIAQSKVFQATIYELMSHFGSAFIIIFAFWVLTSGYSNQGFNILVQHFLLNDIINTSIILTTVCVGVIGLLLLKKYLLIAYEHFRFTNTIYYFFFHFVAGVLFVVTIFLFHSLNPSHYMLVVLAYLIAWLVGYLIPGAPGGLGVREFILLIVLKPILPESVILLAVLSNRIITIFGDVLFFVQAILMKHFIVPNDVANT